MSNLIKENTINFVKSCELKIGKYKLNKYSNISEFGLPFAIFIYHLFGESKHLIKFKEIYSEILVKNIQTTYKSRSSQISEIYYDKYYLQLLCFTLSALKVLGTINNNPLESYTEDLYKNIGTHTYLNNIEALKGKPGSGNFAMFYAINQIHRKLYLNKNSDSNINMWVELHEKNMNKNGLWSNKRSCPYIQFQNGYHQYEILNFLDRGGNYWDNSARLVLSLQDSNGQFAPYPGGGGCYDYDAIYFLTSKHNKLDLDPDFLFYKTINSIITSINDDGGSAENIYLRPLNIKNILKIFNHIFSKRNGFNSRLITNLKLILPKHNKLKTHWPIREWGESNLWDTWFRHLTIFRLCERYPEYLSKEDYGYSSIGFIDYPGIGFF